MKNNAILGLVNASLLSVPFWAVVVVSFKIFA